MGPFIKAEDETATHLRYLMVACLVVPLRKTGKPVLGPDKEQAELEEKTAKKEVEVTSELAEKETSTPSNVPSGDRDAVIPLQDLAPPDLWQELDEPIQDPEDAELEIDPVVLEESRRETEGMTKADCEVQGLCWKEVIFVEPIKRKTPRAVEEALTRVLMQLAEYGLPVNRIHTDCGTEFISPNMRRVTTKHQLQHTSSALKSTTATEE